MGKNAAQTEGVVKNGVCANVRESPSLGAQTDDHIDGGRTVPILCWSTDHYTKIATWYMIGNEQFVAASSITGVHVVGDVEGNPNEVPECRVVNALGDFVDSQ